MKPLGKIRQTKRGQWRYTRETFGFSPFTERKTFTEWRDAIRYATDRFHSTGGTQIEQAFEGSDGLAPRARWSHHLEPDE